VFKCDRAAMGAPKKWFAISLRAGVALLAVSLSGCTSLLQGEQYKFPEPDEPVAVVRTPYVAHTALHIINFSESGCYSGWTALGYKDGFIESPVAVGKPLILTYRRELAGKVCQIHFSLIPQDGANYTFSSNSWSEPVEGVVPLLNTDKNYCGLRAVKELRGRKSLEPIKPLRIRTRLACLTFVE
jgi:hypothetical protein